MMAADLLADAIRLLKQLQEPCEGADEHSWRKCKRCAAVHGIEMRFPLSMRLLAVLEAALASPGDVSVVVGPCSHPRIAYMNTTGGGVCVDCRAYIPDEQVPESVKQAFRHGPPIASCLLCGERGPLAVWYSGTRAGVCERCRAAAGAVQCESIRDAALVRADGWMCEKHPGHPWPECPIEKDCAGPGMPWIVQGRANIEALASPGVPAGQGWQDSRGYALPRYVAVVKREDDGVLLEGHSGAVDWEIEVDSTGALVSFYVTPRTSLAAPSAGPAPTEDQ